MTLNYVINIRGAIKKKSKPWSGLDILKFVLVPGLFPFVFFVYGYAFQYPAFYTFLAWNPAGGLTLMFILLVSIKMIINMYIFNYFPEEVVIIDESQIERVVNLNRRILSASQAFLVSLKAGYSEELLFRFIAFFTFLALIKLSDMFLGLSLSSPFLLFPSWLSLGVGLVLSPAVFAAFFLANLLFALIHLLDEEGKPQFAQIQGVIFAWFMGWVITLALIQFGLLGAMVVHLLADFILFWPLFYVKFEYVTKRYWEKKYGPA